jgi:hypothetical protein
MVGVQSAMGLRSIRDCRCLVSDGVLRVNPSDARLRQAPGGGVILWQVVVAALRSGPCALFLIRESGETIHDRYWGLTKDGELFGGCFRKSGRWRWEGLSAKKPWHRWILLEPSRLHGSTQASGAHDTSPSNLYLCILAKI